MKAVARIDHDRARLVFGRLIKKLREKKYPYNIATLPQEMIPHALRDQPLRHAQFIFYACHFMRGALDSTTAIRQLVALWQRSPDLFKPEVVCMMDVGAIAALLRSAIDYHLDEIAAFWKENSDRLQRLWRGDPRRIFEKVCTADVVYRRVVNKESRACVAGNDLFEDDWGFFGFRKKMAGMLAYFLAEAQLIEPICDIAPAVDFHLLRIMIANRILILTEDAWTGGAKYEDVYDEGAEAVTVYMRTCKISAVEIGDALWMLSTTLCREAPGNWSTGRSRKRGNTWQTPTRIDHNGKERKELPQPVVIDQYSSEQLAAYERTCHRCPCRKTCTANAPSGPYYECGLFMPRVRTRMRVRKALFDELHDHPVPRRHKAGIVQRPTGHEQLSLLEPDA
ncbi:hypothetical protein FJY94_05125 [Candidatus Kaiserbacteria bacterium]|nr:hypothetical protein [Candidatus Kaiserbacteria bacterium]